MQYRPLPAELIPRPYNSGVAYDSFTVNGPRYYTHLANALREKGITFIRRRVSALDEVYAIFPDVSLVINASGLGSRSLLGVEDSDVYPARGQTVLIHAPHIQTCYNHRMAWTGPARSYIIPRPGLEGSVILGGTYEPNNHSTLPDPKEAERIMRDACVLCPDLGPWNQLDVISHQCGLRPMRKGGMRLELEQRLVGGSGTAGLTPALVDAARGKTVNCIHAYGIGSAG